MCGTLIVHIHALIDLVDETEGSFGMSRQTHEIQNRGERTFLSMIVKHYERHQKSMAYPSRLPFCRKKLQTFFVPKFDINLDCPLVEVFVLCNSDLASAADTCVRP